VEQPILWYFADPMCSWCWGFAPVIEAIREGHRDRLKVALVLGGLRPGTTRTLSPREREEILHHWRQVSEMTGQPFRFEGALPEAFVYDTEPASRAVVAMGELDREAVFPLFKSIQAAFYAAGRDVTRPEVLADLAFGLDADRAAFLDALESDAVRSKTAAHFEMARRLGVGGFPTLVLQRGDRHRVLARGYRPLVELQAELASALAELGA
jgi:putative protein-disulfide isomerase